MLNNIQLKFCCILIGEDYSRVKNYQHSSRRKIILMGSSLLIPVLTWVIFTTAIAINIYRMDSLSSIAIGVLAGFVVLMIERSIILSKPGNDVWKILIGLFRVCLGLVIAYLSAVFIDQIIFKNDIDNQIPILRNRNLEGIEQEVKNRFNKQLSDLDVEKKQAYNVWQISLKQFSSEADGTGGGKIRGAGIVTQIKQTIAKQNEQNFNKATSRLDSIIAIRDAEIQIKKSKSIFSDTAFLTRIEALNSLLSENNEMHKFYLFITAFFIMIESLVVILKFSSKQSIDEFLEEKRELLEKERINKLTEDNLNLVRYSYQHNEIENSTKKMNLLPVLN